MSQGKHVVAFTDAPIENFTNFHNLRGLENSENLEALLKSSVYIQSVISVCQRVDYNLANDEGNNVVTNTVITRYLPLPGSLIFSIPTFLLGFLLIPVYFCLVFHFDLSNFQ